MGNPINKEIYVDHNGRRVYFCCQMCVEQFKKEPEKYLKKLDEHLRARPGQEGSTHKEAGAHEGHEHH
jgi:YHS domain-containing protein